MVNCENDEVSRSRSTYDALSEREMPSTVKYGSVCATLNTWLYLPPLSSTASRSPEPNRLLSMKLPLSMND